MRSFLNKRVHILGKNQLELFISLQPRDQLRARLLSERTLEEEEATLAQWGINMGSLRTCMQEGVRLTFAEECDWL